MPVGKLVKIYDTNNIFYEANFEGFIEFGGIPSIYLTDEISATFKKEIIIPINQVVSFEVKRPKTILL
jgi:hypothetical protein